MHTITWNMDCFISITVLAGFVFKVSWMDIERQSKLYMFDEFCYGRFSLVILFADVNIEVLMFIYVKSASVRKASILALQNLYDVDDNVPSLGLFTERFYKRMLDLADDIDISVAVCAISLVKKLLRYLSAYCLYFHPLKLNICVID